MYNVLKQFELNEKIKNKSIYDLFNEKSKVKVNNIKTLYTIFDGRKK